MNDQFDPKKEVEPQNGSAAVKTKSIQREILEWVLAIVIAVILALIIRETLFTVVKVDGASMQNTLQHNDRLIVWRLGYEPKAGDIIVLQQEGKAPYIKRVIATEGQEVNIDFVTHEVSVDGVVLDEPYIKEPTSRRGDVKFPVVVPDDCVFVMGDNRNNSMDSRVSSVGMVENDDVMGKAVLRIFPFQEFGLLTH